MVVSEVEVPDGELLGHPCEVDDCAGAVVVVVVVD